MKIGVVSDTHGFFDVRLSKLFAGVEAILHAGDVGSREVLDELGRIAPVHAVRGNVDPADAKLPLTLTLKFGRLQVEVMHILPVPQSELQAWSAAAMPGGKASPRRQRFLKAFDESTGVVVFGHSHLPCQVKMEGRLFFNPGSAGKKRFSLPRCCGLLETSCNGIRATIRPLERYNGVLPEEVHLNFAKRVPS